MKAFKKILSHVNEKVFEHLYSERNAVQKRHSVIVATCLIHHLLAPESSPEASVTSSVK